MTRKTYTKYLLRILSCYWPEEDIISFRKTLRAAYWNADAIAFADKTNAALATDLLARFERAGEARITPEQSEKGLAWLRRACFTTKGEIRNAKSRPFEDVECRALLSVLDNFSHCTFDALSEVTNLYSSQARTFIPVYTLHTKDGRRFSYSMQPMGEVECLGYDILPKQAV